MSTNPPVVFRSWSLFKSLVVHVAVVAMATVAFAQGDTSGEKVVALTPNETVASITAWPKQISSHQRLSLMPWEVLRAAGLEQFGIDPLQIERVDVLVGMPGLAGPQVGAIFQLSQDLQLEDLHTGTLELDPNGPTTEGEFTWWPHRSGEFGLHQVDARTLLAGTSVFLKQMATTRQTPGKVAALLGAVKRNQDVSAIVSVDMLRPLIEGLLDRPMQQAPPQLRDDVFSVVQNSEFMALGLTLTPREKLTLVISGEDEAAGAKLDESTGRILQFATQTTVEQIKAQIGTLTPTANATRDYVDRISAALSQRSKPVRKGKVLMLELADFQTIGVTGVSVGLLLPAVQAAREAARRMQSSNNLKQLALAMHNFESTFRAFPATAGVDENGKPLISWRVAILPFIEQQQLYEKFHLDEPWDSEHNIKLLEQMPDTFRHPSRATRPGYTVYQAPISEHSLLRETEPTTLAQITDGTSNTIMLIETSAEAAVPWTKPEDYRIDEADPKKNLFSNGITQAAFGDGSVRPLAESIDIEVLKALFTREGGEVIPHF